MWYSAQVDCTLLLMHHEGKARGFGETDGEWMRRGLAGRLMRLSRERNKNAWASIGLSEKHGKSSKQREARSLVASSPSCRGR